MKTECLKMMTGKKECNVCVYFLHMKLEMEVKNVIMKRYCEIKQPLLMILFIAISIKR